MRHVVIEETNVSDMFQYGDPAPHMWIQNCPNIDDDFLPPSIDELIDDQQFVRLPCGELMRRNELYFHRHRCTKFFLQTPNDSILPDGYGCASCGATYPHPLMAYYCHQNDRSKYHAESEPVITSASVQAIAEDYDGYIYDDPIYDHDRQVVAEFIHDQADWFES